MSIRIRAPRAWVWYSLVFAAGVIPACSGEDDASQLGKKSSALVVDLVTYTFEGATPNETAPTTVDSGVTASNISREGATTSVTFNAGNPGSSMNSGNWVNTSAGTDWYTFTVTPNAGTSVSLSTLGFDTYRSSTGPTSFEAYVVQGSTVTSVGTGTIVASTWTSESLP